MLSSHQTAKHYHVIWTYFRDFFLYLFEAVVHYIVENLRHKQAKPGDQQETSDDPHRGDRAGSSRHVCRCKQHRNPRLRLVQMNRDFRTLS